MRKKSRDKRIKILKAIRDGEKYSRNNQDMSCLERNGYIRTKGVTNTSYVNAEIILTEWGDFWLNRELKNE